LLQSICNNYVNFDLYNILAYLLKLFYICCSRVSLKIDLVVFPEITNFARFLQVFNCITMANYTLNSTVSKRKSSFWKSSVVLILFIMLFLNKSSGQVMFTSTSGSTWFTNSNWNTGSYPGTPSTNASPGVGISNNQYAIFGSFPSSTIGINMSTSNGNGYQGLSIGGLEINRTTSLTLQNSTSSKSGTIFIYGGTINSIDNVILRNLNSGTFIIDGIANAGLSFSLNNGIDNIINIDGTGGIIIASTITGPGKNLTKAGSGSGILTLSNPSNTYSGTTTITNGELRLNPSSTIATFASQIVLNGGTVSTTNIVTNTTITSSATLKIDVNSNIILGTNVHSLKFANSRGIEWIGTTLNIIGWVGSPGSSGTLGKIYIGIDATGLSSEQLTRIHFDGYALGAQILGTGEVVPISDITNPTTFTTTTSSTTQIDLSATANANSDNIFVISNSTGSFATPTDGVASGNVGDSFAGGTIIYKGSAAGITNHTGLNANTTYYYKAFSYDGSNNYSSGLSANATTAKIEPTNQPTSIQVSTIVTASSIPLIWIAATTGSQAPDGYLVKLSTGAISDPVDGTDPGARSTAIISGAATYKATIGASFSDALAGTMYNVKIYSYTNSGTLIDFNTNSVPTFNVATPPNPVNSASVTATSATTANITWTAASGYDNSNNSTLVFVKATNAITTGTPTNAPSAYTANTAFGSGTAYQGDGSATCIYNGDGTSVSVTGLSANTTYYVLIYTVVDATNSNLKNAYSTSTTTSGTTNNLPAPTANSASSMSATGFTANWNPVEGANNYKLDVSTLPIFGTVSPSTLTEGFDGGITPPANWTFTNIENTYTTSINSGINTPSLQLDATNDRVLTPTLNGVATRLSFWIKGQATDAASALLVEGYNGSAWVTIKNITNSIPTTGTTYTFNSGSNPALPTDINQFRFTFTKSAGNISFDDVSINYDIITPSLVTGYNNLNTGNTTYQFITGLSPNTTYYYRVRATNSNSTSANSNTTAATTSNTISVNSTVNASTLPVCSSCDVSVSNGALLNIDETRTFNTITVESGGKMTNGTGSTLSATTLNLNSNASGTATYLDNGTSQIGTTNVQQYLTSGRNWYVSSPVTAANISSLSTATSIVYWDETIGNWATQGTTLSPMRGYISVSTNDSKAITFSGILNNGNKTIGLTRTTGKTKEGFNLVGNPYPSYLNWTSATATAANALTTIWYRTQTAGAYAFHTYNATGGIGVPVGVTGEIPPMQAFWVRANEGGGTLTLNNTMRSHGNGSNSLKVRAETNNTQPQMLRLQVSNGTSNDEAVIYFNANASDSYDAYDSPKMTNANASIPEIFTMAGTEKVVINGLNVLTTNKEIPLGFSTGETNNFTIKANDISIDPNIAVILRDKLLSTDQELTAETSYSFTSEAANTTDRFSVIFRTASITTGIDKHSKKQNIEIYRNANNQIVVHYPGNISSNSSVSVYNSLGQMLTHKPMENINTVINIENASGICMVNIINEEINTTKKVVLK
jgi:autotransporter-associated beta strand protein